MPHILRWGSISLGQNEHNDLGLASPAGVVFVLGSLLVAYEGVPVR